MAQPSPRSAAARAPGIPAPAAWYSDIITPAWRMTLYSGYAVAVSAS